MLAVGNLQAAPGAPRSRRLAAASGSPLPVPPLQGREPTGQPAPQNREPT